MDSIQIVAGCPFSDKHNQTPGTVTDDPLEAINEYGNYGRAIELLKARIGRDGARATDYELLAYALRSIGRPADAAENYRNALDVDPNHGRASNWRQHIHECERAARNSSHVLRPNGITIERLTSESHLPPGAEQYAWVIDNSGWIKPNAYVPSKSLGDHVMNVFYAKLSNALAPVGRLVNRLVPERPTGAGRWTWLPNWAKGVLRLADLAYRRDWMLDNARLPPGVKKTDKNAGPDFSPNAFSPDGRGNNPSYRNVGGVGTPVPFHGLPENYPAWNRANDARLPSPAALANDFGYRKGTIHEALTASAHAWGHLQLLVHDVLQTVPDDVRKHPVPVAPGSEEAEIGIKNVHYRSDAIDPLGGPGNRRMNSVTGAWDMSPIYGSSVEQIARIRTNPNTGQPCPDGKIYLDGVHEHGRGGLYLPTEINENGEEVLLTGFARNMTMPLEAEHTLYARHHNWVCDVLRERHPEWDDNQVFNIARRVVTLTYVKIHTAPWTDALFAHPSVVQGLHANIFGRREWKKPVDQQRIYDPRGGNNPIADGLVSNQDLEYDIPEAKGNNFNDAYRFGHTIVPDIHYFPPIGETTVKGQTEAVNLRDLRELDGHRFLKERGLGFAFHGLMNTRLGAPIAGNYADFFRRMDTEEGIVDLFEAEIVKDRQRGTPAYNDYLRSHNLPALRSFADLFKDPQAVESKEQIAKLEAHYPGGVEHLDTPLGLLLNQFRPDGFAITNPGFQTFVFEATSRIAKQTHLTRLWSPEHVGWTAINLVEAMNKEKLLYLHCPELREYLKTRPNRNTYEYMGTSAQTHPEEHPLARILTYADEDLADTGLGDPWRDEHFDEKALEQHYLLRVHHTSTSRSFIVDLTEETVRFDRNGDGRIRGSEIMHEALPSVTRAELLAAAKDIRDKHAIPWPGCECTYNPSFVSGWRLTSAETKRLKMFEGDPNREGVTARLTDLQVHLLIFHLGDDIEHARLPENMRGWRAIEQSPLRAVIMSLMSAVRFGANPLSFAIPTAMHAMAKRRPTKSTGIFDRNGMIDQARLGEYRAGLRELAQKSDDGHVSKDAFMELLRERGALGLTTRNQWGSFFRLMKRLHGRETITVDAFDKLYSGKLLIEAFEQFAPEEIKAKPAPRPPELAQTASSPPGLTHRPNNELVDEQAKRSNLPKPPLPKGAFIGKSSTLSGRDRMSLQLRPDPSNAQCYFAILSEYTRQRPPLPSFLPDRLQITNWVPRMHAYHVDYAGDNQFNMMPLCVGPDGNLVPDRSVPASRLHIGSDGMREAILTRVDKNGRTAETISFDGSKSTSIWEDYIPGKFFLSSDRSGGDYFTKKSNTVMSGDRMVTFMTDHLRGDYDALEKAPGIFTLKSRKPGQLGAKAVEKRLLVFIDIVNWKPIATTSKALLVDPDNAGNVSLFYQRHDRSMIASIRELIRKPFNGGSKQLEAPNTGGGVN